jgi:hypothetical protein
MLFSMWVPLAYSDFFHVLTWTSLYALQFVSALTHLFFLVLHLTPTSYLSLCASLTFLVLLNRPISIFYAFQKVSFFLIFSCFILTSSFLCIIDIIFKAKLFLCQCTSLIYTSMSILLIHFQPPLLVSSDDHMHHKLIGTFLLLYLC